MGRSRRNGLETERKRKCLGKDGTCKKHIGEGDADFKDAMDGQDPIFIYSSRIPLPSPFWISARKKTGTDLRRSVWTTDSCPRARE